MWKLHVAEKKTNDSSDKFGWQCRRIHTVTRNGMKYKVVEYWID